MQSLVKLINCLKPGEVKLVKHYFSLKSNKENDRRNQLFQLILKGKIKSNEDGVRLLYNNITSSAFSKLKSRLEHEILNLLVLSDSDKLGTTSREHALFSCHRIMAQGETLLKRGLIEEGIGLLHKAENYAIKAELNTEQLLISETLVRYNSRSGVVADNEKLDQLDRIDQIINARYLLAMLNSPENDPDKEAAMLTSMLPQVMHHSSPEVVANWHFSMMRHLRQQKEYDRTITIGKELIEFIESRRHAIGNCEEVRAYFELALSHVYLGQYEEARKHEDLAFSKIGAALTPASCGLDRLFITYLHTTHLEEAERVWQRPEVKRLLDRSDKVNARWRYLAAGLEFQKGDHKESLKLLTQENSGATYFKNWTHGVALLEMMNHIELNSVNQVCYRLDSMKKLLYRYKKDNVKPFINRFEQIVKVLSTFVKNDFSFVDTVEKEQESLHLLNGSGRCEYHWEPFGFEVIRFDEWMNKKSIKGALKLH